ncbi:MAG: ribonuclease D, partial [Armatimonadetes bacterium]|nr:ribonuclease D [Armatimonadota bacterium]
MHSPQFVQTPAQLADLVTVLHSADAVAVDTEFVGEGLYEPLLCLIQIATREGIWIVDPLAVPSTEPFWESVTAPEREFVVFAAREELRFCLRYARRVPARLLDIQLAAGLVGYGYPLSHSNAVRKALNVTLPGSEAFTDWRKRPLTQSQIDYAADDVRHLLPMRDKLADRARRLGRSEWLADESQKFADRLAVEEQEERWWKVPGSSNLRRRELGVLREVWRWRDSVARRDGVPPRRVLRDELLVEVARRKPRTTADLFALRGMERGPARNAGAEIVRSVQTALDLPDEELPTSLRRDDVPQLSSLSQLLSVVANGLAAEHHVDPQLLATASDLQDLVRWKLGAP